MKKFVCVAVLLASVCVAGCASMPGKGGQYGPAEQTRAEEVFASLRSSVSAGQFDQAGAAATEIINSYPRFAHIDEVYFLAGQAADGRKDYTQAAAYYDQLADAHATSAFRAQALAAAAADYSKLNDGLREAERLLELDSMPLDEKARAVNTRRLQTVAQDDLTMSQVDDLAHRYPDSVLARETLLRQARSAYANGDYDKSYEMVSKYLEQAPRGDTAEDARRLLENAAERRQTPPPGPATRVSADRVGLVFPQTGSLALYGRFFEQGAKAAVDEYNEKAPRRVSLVAADSRGGAVDAVKAVRKLVVEDGALALVGDVFTLPAIASAIECNAWRTPIVSPVVTSDDLVEIGTWVFQTRVPDTIEATVLAEVAVQKLGLKNIAVLSPARGDRRATADFFADEVRRLGGQVAAQEQFAEGATDFKAQLEKIHDARPDALFAIGSLEELLQILPQTKFFDLQVQLFGTSQWNSDKLLRLARDELEGAIFPAEAQYGSSDARDRALKERIMSSGATDLSPVAVAAYYGTRVVLDALAGGASSREDVRKYLDSKLRGDAANRRERAATLPLVRVQAGAVQPYTR
ncbi:MAG TPA: ABC transporter substrate-binding protein [Candidatus Krumholzibacteria bacterium]